jgi:transposase
MAYRQSERPQQCLFPQSLEDYVGPEDPVRAYDAFVEALDLESLEIAWAPHEVGCPSYSPRLMLKILVYGYSYGIRSSRKLERALYHNVSFMWLAGGLKPDFKTISRFRRDHRKALAQVLQQCARLCIELGLIEGNTLFVDGSKFRSNASLSHRWTVERCERSLAQIEQQIEAILAECDAIDAQEDQSGSLVQLQGALANKHTLKAKIEKVLEKLRKADLDQINTTDPDAASIHGRQGSHAGYNAQIVVDDRHGLIVHSDVVNDNNDLGQFADQIKAANQTLDRPCQIACGDAGFSNAEVLEPVDAQGIQVIVPSSKQARGQTPGPFDKSSFQYDTQADAYVCPTGTRLAFRRINGSRGEREYYPGRGVCTECPHWGVCTSNETTGRKIIRYENEAFREKLAARYQEPASQAVFRRRKEKVELPFGHLKHNLGVDSFLLRGLAGVRAEMSLLSSCFNLARLITLLGVAGLVARLTSR